MADQSPIKVEPDGSGSSSVHSHASVSSPNRTRMAPPALPTASRVFSRSGAPSIDTRPLSHRHTLRGDDNQSTTTHDTPQLLELRHRHSSHNEEHQSTPSSHAGDYANQSFTHRSFTDIGLKLKACNDTLGELQQLGIQHVAQLPELVMVGDQSAGKSSLMSGLAELDLPRSGGVCTRCPIHIRLSRDNRWSCTVSLNLDYDFHIGNRSIRKSDVTRSNPFPPWVPKPHRITKVFKSIDFEERSQTEDVLRWAQVAILNPNSAPDLYIPGEGANAREMSLQEAVLQTEAQFSPNIVALELKGPTFPDLSFYDLPGVFSTPAREEDEYLVQVVKNLTSHYIRRPEAIILWALPMNNDPETSISLGLIRDAKAQGRTVGVVTKADMIRPEDAYQWVEVLRNAKHSVGQGYFITSRPRLENFEAGEPLERLNHWEEQFFNSNDQNWPSELQEFSHRCGVDVLKEFLSKKLGEAFSNSLPSIKVKVNEHLNKIRGQLSELPELPTNVEYEVRKSVYDFSVAVKEAIDNSEFQATWNELNKSFQACILAIKPSCLVKDRKLHLGTGQETSPLDLTTNSDAESATVLYTPSKKRPRPSDSTVRNTPKRSRPEPWASTPVKQEDPFSRSHSGRSTSAFDESAAAQSPFLCYHNLGRRGLDLIEIQRQMARYRPAGVPTKIVPTKVYDVLIMDAIKKWENPLEMYLTMTMDLFQSVLHHALHSSMSTLSKRMIFTRSQAHLDAYIQKMNVTQRGKILDIFDSEQYQMFTTNDEAFKRYRDEELQGLVRVRNIYRCQTIGAFPLNYVAEPLDQMSADRRQKERDDITKGLAKLSPDVFMDEIEVAATIRGYYRLAAMRFVENVTLSFYTRLFKNATSSAIHDILSQELGLNRPDEDTFSRLMEEDMETAQKREQLKREREKLKKAMQSIENLQFCDGTDLDGVNDTNDTTGGLFVDDPMVYEV